MIDIAFDIIAIKIAKKVLLSIAAKEVTGGIYWIFKKSPERKVEKALRKALKKVAHDNEFWKNDVIRQRDDVLNILIKKIGGTTTSKIELPNYLDQGTVDAFCKRLKKDPVTWDYLQKLVYDYILREIRDIAIDTKDIAQDTNARVKNIENKLDSNNVNSSTNEHFLTSTPPKADSTNVIGRDKDLQMIWEVLKDKKHVILTGFGGIGKTKLAQMLFHKYEAEFDEVAWIEYRGNLMDSFLASITVKQFSESNYGNDKVARWNAINSSLTNDGKTKLIIIDNMNGDTNQHPRQDMELKNLTGWKDTTVLLTSRLDRLGGFQKIELKELTEDYCIDLFYYYFANAKPTREIVAKIVGLANMHTFTIELLAKGAEREDLEKYYERLIEKGFGYVSRIMDTEHHLKETTIEKHLKILFDMQNRSVEDKKVLNSFAVLPEYCRCSIEEIQNWFGFENADLDQVIRDGWLTYNEDDQQNDDQQNDDQQNDDQRYYIHSLVRTIIRFDFLEDGQGKKTIAPEGTTDKILEYFDEHREHGLFDINMGFVSLQRMIGIVEAVIGAVDEKESVRFARLYHRIGWSYDDLGDYNKALEYYGKALEIKESKLGKDDTDTAATYNNIAVVYKNMGDYDKALEYYEKDREISESKLGKDHPSTAATYNNMASVYRAKGDYYKALEYYEKALEIRESKLGKDHPDTATTYNNMAGVYYAKGDYDKALEYYEKALKIRESKLGKDHPDTATTYNNMAGVYYAKGDYDKALEYYGKALKIRESKLGKDHPDTATTYNNIALVYEAKGDYDKALEYYLKALRIWLNRDVNHPDAKTIFENFIDCYQKANMEKDFDEWLKEQLNEKEWEAYLELKGL